MMRVWAALLVALLGVRAPDPDWLEYASLHASARPLSAAERSEALETVRALPVSVHWDAAKAAFRTALVGELLARDRRFESYLSRRPSRVMSNGSLALVSVLAVDLARLCTDAAVALQLLAARVHAAEGEVGLALVSRGAMLAAGAGWAGAGSSACARREVAALQGEERLADRALKARAEATERGLSEIGERTALRKSELAAHGARLALDAHAHLARVGDVRAQGRLARGALAEEQAREQRLAEDARLAAEHALAVAEERASILSAGAALLVRVREQGLADRDLEPGRAALLLEQHLQRVAGLRNVTGVVFAELRAAAGGGGLARLCAALLCAALLLLLASETLQLARSALGAGPSLDALSLRPAPPAEERLMLEGGAAESLARALAMLALSAERALPPPLLLVRGPRGSGRSTLCAHVAARAGMRACVVNCGALAGGAGAALRGLRGRGAGLLVLDDADELAAAPSDALCQVLALAAEGMAVLLAVGDCCAVLPSLRDRLSMCVALGLPGEQTRLAFLRRETASLLGGLLPADGEAWDPACVDALAVRCEGRSLSALAAVVRAVQSRVLGAEGGALTTELWLDEVQRRL